MPHGRLGSKGGSSVLHFKAEDVGKCLVTFVYQILLIKIFRNIQSKGAVVYNLADRML